MPTANIYNEMHSMSHCVCRVNWCRQPR